MPDLPPGATTVALALQEREDVVAAIHSLGPDEQRRFGLALLEAVYDARDSSTVIQETIHAWYLAALFATGTARPTSGPAARSAFSGAEAIRILEAIGVSPPSVVPERGDDAHDPGVDI